MLLFFAAAAFVFVVIWGLEAMVARSFVKRIQKTMAASDNYKLDLQRSYHSAVSNGWTAIIGIGLLLTMVVLFGFSRDDTRSFLMLYVGGVMVTLLVVYVGGSPGRIKKMGLVRVLMGLMAKGSKAEVEGFAMAAVGFGDTKHELILVQAMEKWGGRTALEVIEEAKEAIITKEDSMHTDSAKYAAEVQRNLKSSFKSMEREDAVAFAQLSERYLLFQRMGAAASTPGALGTFLGDELDAYPFHARLQALNEAFPHCFCTKCYSRVEEFIQNGHVLVRCKNCQESEHLLLGITSVVGLIGGKGDFERAGDVLTVSIWDTMKKKARYAEVDSLRFGEVDSENADWTLASILETLDNQLPEDKKPIPLENSPPSGLSKNALLQLERLTTFH